MSVFLETLRHWTRLYCTDHIDHEGDSVPCPGHWVKEIRHDDS